MYNLTAVDKFDVEKQCVSLMFCSEVSINARKIKIINIKTSII